MCLQAEEEQRAREAASASKLAPVEEKEEPTAEQPAAEVSLSLKADLRAGCVGWYTLSGLFVFRLLLWHMEHREKTHYFQCYLLNNDNNNNGHSAC